MDLTKRKTRLNPMRAPMYAIYRTHPALCFCEIENIICLPLAVAEISRLFHLSNYSAVKTSFHKQYFKATRDSVFDQILPLSEKLKALEQ